MTAIEQFNDAFRRYSEAKHAVAVELRAAGHHDITPERAAIVAALKDGEQPLKWLLFDAYYGSNASYNVKQLVDTGYVETVESAKDRRIKMLRNTDKGLALWRALTSAQPAQRAA